MTSYTIIFSCPELSLEHELFTFDLPEIKIDDQVANTQLVTAVFNRLKKLNLTATSDALLAFLTEVVAL